MKLNLQMLDKMGFADQKQAVWNTFPFWRYQKDTLPELELREDGAHKKVT